MVVMACPHIVKKVATEYVSVETDGKLTRGMTIMDRRRWIMKQPTSPFEVPASSKNNDTLIISTDESPKDKKLFNGEVQMEKNGGKVRVIEQVDPDLFFSEYMRVVFDAEWQSDQHAWVQH